MRVPYFARNLRRFRTWWPARTGRGGARKAPAQIALYMAVIMTSLAGLAGAGVDYGLIVLESSRLQHALDAGALAGARALVTATGDQTTAGNAAATNYLSLHGYVNGQNDTTITLTPSSSQGNAWLDTMQVRAVRVLPTRFWRIIGINSSTLDQRATAAAGSGMVDVMLSLDLSGSMERSGTDDLGQLRSAVVAFIDQMQVDATQPRGTKVGIARWAGIKCSWYRSWNNNPNDFGADGDTYVDTDRGPGGSEYVSPCSDDATIITNLTQDRALLVKIADGSGAATCPTGMNIFACPLQSWKYSNPPVVYGTPTVPAGLQDNGTTLPVFSGTCSSGSEWCQATGTKIANGITVTNNGLYHAWATANGGRNDPNTTGLARKVLVLMTDGVNESSQIGIPSDYSPSLANWDTTTTNAAAALKLGPDGVAGTVDDVEIYVVGFFCTPYNASSSWCRSRLADTNQPHPCPGTTWPTASPAPSSIDTLLRNVSSSAPGTCSHYFPIKKTESLPQLFRIMAGSIARGRLQ